MFQSRKMASRRCNGDARDLLECSICLEPYRVPKCLPCIHTFCLECLEKCMQGEDKLPGDIMHCPLCCGMFTIPADGGFKKLPNNFFIEQFVANRNALREGSIYGGETCDVCRTREASGYCVDCTQSMCNACEKTHGKLKASQSHKVVSLSEKEGSQSYTRARPTYCDVHKDKQLELYCYDCHKVVCLVCSAVSHKAHQCSDLRSSSKNFCDELQRGYPDLKRSIDVITSEQQSLDDNKVDFLNQIEASERAIVERSEELKRFVDKHCSKLLNQLGKVRDEEMKKIQERKNEVDAQLLILLSFRTYVGELTTEGSVCAVSQNARDLLARGRQLQTELAEFSKGRLGQGSVMFEPAAMLESISGPRPGSLIGEITVDGNIAPMPESVFVVVGLSERSRTSQHVYHVSLERPDSVSTIDSTPAAVKPGAAACVVGDNLYAVGIGRACNELWKWNEASGWLRCEDMTSRRRRHRVAVFNSTLYALGGCLEAPDTTLCSVEAYNTQTNKWSSEGQLTHAVRSAACVTYKGAIYLFGGETVNSKLVAHVQVYNVVEHNCTLLHNPMPRAYSGMKAVVWETYTILLNCDTCFIYNFKTDSWLEREAFKTELSHFGLVVDSDALYIAGGGSSERDKDNKVVWTCTDEVQCVSVRDVIEDKRGSRWKHHATLPLPALIHAFSPVPLSLTSQRRCANIVDSSSSMCSTHFL